MNFNKKYNKGNPVLSKRLKSLRKESGFTQEQLAELIESNGGKCSSANYVSMLENSKRAISKQMAHCLSRIFGIDAEYLLDEAVVYRTSTDKRKDEIKRQNEHNFAVMNNAKQEANYMDCVINYLAALNGYTVEIKDIAAETAKVISTGNGTIEGCFKDYMVFSQRGKKEFSISLLDARTFGNILAENFMTFTKWIYKRK